MNQQDCHKDGVSPRKQVVEAACSAHAVAEDQISQVIRMSCQTPPSRDKHYAFVGQAIACLILHPEDLGLGSPDEAIALGTSRKVFLVVYRAKQSISTSANDRQANHSRHRQGYWTASEVLRL